jgi:ribonuclease Z
MLKSFALRGRELPLTLYGPLGLDDLLRSLPRIFGRLSYEVAVVEFAEGAVLRRDGYEVRTFGVRHGRDALGYALVEDERPGRFDVAAADALGIPFGPGAARSGGTPVTSPTPPRGAGAGALEGRPGRKLVLTGDTAPPTMWSRRARSRPEVHEATFCEEEAERARETEHSTALEAARVARDAGVTLLALTHLSSRYGAGEVEREARTVFPATVVPRDFDLVDIPFAERGGPELVKSGARLPRADLPSSA